MQPAQSHATIQTGSSKSPHGWRNEEIFSVKDCLKNRHERAALSTAKDVNRNDINNTAMIDWNGKEIVDINT
jgi:hypothetical protein